MDVGAIKYEDSVLGMILLTVRATPCVRAMHSVQILPAIYRINMVNV